MRKMTKALLGAVALPAAIAASNIPVVRAACGPCRPKASNPCSPCAAKKAKKAACNPCNPCAAKKAKSPCNPCAAKKAASPCNPCAAKNPCNPCNPCAAGNLPVPKKSDVTRPAGTKPFAGDRSTLVALGKKLYSDTSLSTNQMACSSCHTDMMGFNDTFKKSYPHLVQMPQDVSGMTQISAEGMVQFCLIRPMMSKPLPWDSKELAGLTAYVEDLQKEFAKR